MLHWATLEGGSKPILHDVFTLTYRKVTLIITQNTPIIKLE
jgi:hypothetical protein